MGKKDIDTNKVARLVNDCPLMTMQAVSPVPASTVTEMSMKGWNYLFFVTVLSQLTDSLFSL